MIWRFLLLLIGLHPLHAHQYSVRLGDAVVIVKQQFHGKGPAFVHLHQNEKTALKAANAVVKGQGGSVLTLVHSGSRNVVFHLHHKRYEFDPNRIFTDVGIKKSLHQFGPYTPEAHREVKKLAEKIKVLLPKGKIIAVHNNNDYSLKNYFPGQDHAADAQALNIRTPGYYRNFYLVTQRKDYRRLRKFNSIWQAFNVTDDGSLSVYLAGDNYINVEAGYDQLAAQITMLKHA